MIARDNHSSHCPCAVCEGGGSRMLAAMRALKAGGLLQSETKGDGSGLYSLTLEGERVAPEGSIHALVESLVQDPDFKDNLAS